jgi:hypothetical protein
VPGDGTSLWVVTHNSDFAVGLIGLLGHMSKRSGTTFQITSDEVLTWNQITTIVAAGGRGRGTGTFIHIPSDFIGRLPLPMRSAI